ncbi:MAG: O-antigen ligase family protein [Candidatus Omnitrophica bacterium]|nr:O-antigen ligase family protein [Candidatus Omnitrophota bacterium]
MKNRILTWIEILVLTVIAVRPSLDAMGGWPAITFGSAGPLSLNPAGVASLLMLALGFAWLLLSAPGERAAALRHPAVLLFGAWLILLIPWAVVPVYLHGASRLASLREWVRLFSLLPLFVILLNLSARGNANRILAALFLSLIVPALTALYQIAFHEGMLVQKAHRIQSTFPHPNPFSFYLVMMIGLAYWKCRWSERRTGWILLLLLSLGLLISTFSFTGAGMLGVLILMIAIGESRRLRLTILSSLILFALVFVATPTGRQRIRTITQWDNLDEIERTGRETSSMVWRLLNWRFLIRTWKKSPWAGYGLDSSPIVNPNRAYQGTGPGQEPHNDYIRFLIDAGVIGLFFYLIWLAGIGLLLMRAYRQANAPPVRGFIWIAAALYAAWLAGSANDNLIIATAYQYCLWAVFAAALGWPAAAHPTGGHCEEPNAAVNRRNAAPDAPA